MFAVRYYWPTEIPSVRKGFVYESFGGSAASCCVGRVHHDRSINRSGRYRTPASAQEVTDCTAATISNAECDALVDLYNATGGAATWVSKANWLLGDNPCGWYGVTCSNATGGSVTLLNLYNNKLSNAIPASIGNLTNLQTLNLYNNDLSGAIPTEIGNLTNLQTLNLFNNDLSDEIPASIGNLANLQTLSLSGNDLSGAIPTEIGNLTNLQTLYLYNNRLSGSDPHRNRQPHQPPNPGPVQTMRCRVRFLLRSATSPGLTGLDLGGNGLSGAIPASIGNLANLHTLDLSSNALSGAIPSQIGNLTNLQTLYLSDNELSGEIPSSIGNLASLRGLYLGGNGLSGEIPASIGDLINLTYLGLNPNGCLWASDAVTAFVTGAVDTSGTNGLALDDACMPAPALGSCRMWCSL